ncbi:MAG: Uma2 family endonuclease [Planctomycetes bacterium]|nr:Uma2 family endonuclease [Planctomycetota bacterium]
MATTTVSQYPNRLELNRLLLSPTPDGRVRFSREAYHRLADVGVFNSDSRVELVDGEIFMMSPIGPPQGGLTSRLMSFFVKQLPESLDCRIQLPIVAGEHSEPEPDVAIVLHREDDYQHEHPSPNDVVLIIEVAQSSLDYDLGQKLRLYSESGISEYWVVDVDHRVVLVHREPAGFQYRSVERVVGGGTIAPLAAPDCRLDVGWLFRE